MADIFDELVGAGVPPQALVEQLRRQKQLGTVAGLSLDKRIAQVGQGQVEDALSQAGGIRDRRDRDAAREDQRAFAKWQQEQSLAERQADRDFRAEEGRLNRALSRSIASQRAASRPAAGLSPYEKTQQQAAGRDAAKWMAGDRSNVESNLLQLETARQQLKDNPGLVGGFTRRLAPENRALFDKDSVALQQQIERVTQGNLREVLGGQFAAVEGQQLLARAFNPQLSAEANLKNLDALIGAMKSRAKEKDQYFQSMGGSAGGDDTGDDDLMSDVDAILGGQ